MAPDRWYSGCRGLLLALIAGALLPLAFSPFDQAWLAPLPLVLLFAIWRQASRVYAAGSGYLFGAGYFVTGTSWVYVSMHDYGGASPVAAAILTLLFVAILAGFPALAGFLAVAVASSRRAGWLLLVCPAAWVLSEWCRSWFMTGFPWLQLGYSQLESPLSGFAPVLGVYGLSALVAMIAGLLLLVLQQQGRCPRMLALGGILLLLAVGAGLREISWSNPAGAPFTASLLQGNIDQNLKWQPEVRRQTLQMYIQLTRENTASDLVVWPETAVPAYYDQVRDSIMLPLRNVLGPTHTDLLFGVPVTDAESGRYYNALVSLTGEGEGIYRKRHLVPFGEFLPLQPVSRIILDYLKIPMSDFAAGDIHQPLLTGGGYPLVASICYEDVFGAESLVGVPQAAYLVNVSNDAWFSGSIAPAQHLQMARMRALETSRYMLRATNNGMTAIIDQRGSLLAQAPPYQRAVLTGEVQPLVGRTPYTLTGDWPMLVLVLLGLGIPWMRTRYGAV